MSFQSSRSARVNLEDAEGIAAQGFAFLAAEPPRLMAFLAATGLELDDIRQSAGTREFLAAVLDYLLRDESQLLVFSAEASIPPEQVTMAAHILGGGPPA